MFEDHKKLLEEELSRYPSRLEPWDLEACLKRVVQRAGPFLAQELLSHAYTLNSAKKITKPSMVDRVLGKGV